MEGDSAEGNEVRNAVLRYISQALMEENLEDKDCVIQDSALHAVEKSLYEILNEKSLPLPDEHLSHEETSSKSDYSFNRTSASNSVGSGTISYLHESFHVKNSSACASSLVFDAADELGNSLANVPLESQSSWWFGGWVEESKRDFPSGGSVFVNSQRNIITVPKSAEKCLEMGAKLEKWEGNLPDRLQRGKKSLQLGESDVEGRSNKNLASEIDESILHEFFDKVLSFDSGTDGSALNMLSFPNESNRECQQNVGAQESNIEMFCNRRGATKREAVVIRSLLLQCMQSVVDNNKMSAGTLLKQIRLRSSPTGDGCQRLAYYFVNGLEARLLGVGNPEHRAISQRVMTDGNILKAILMFYSTLPFTETAYFFSAQMIMELGEQATSIHVIHFGIIWDAQWPYLIHCLSRRPIGPPKLRITGIDLPQSGFRPDARVRETGCRLASYCEKLNVPFQYNGIAQKWETLSVEDLRIEKDEVVIVECFGQLMYLLDDTVMEDSPRDAVLNLIRIINPDIFVHGIFNGTYNSPFFISRFREAFFYYSSVFDMFDVNLPRENLGRMVFEREMMGKAIVNILASEGVERIERPETYKQWQKRMIRAGLRQLPLNREISNTVRARVKSRYHKDFFVDESSEWLLEGWKGQVMFAFSCWKAA